MRQASTGLCGLLIVAVLAIGAIAATGSAGESSAAVAIAKSGLLGGFGEQLKREDDAQEVKELRESEPLSREERVEAHEQAEEATMEAAHHDEGEGNNEAAQLATQGGEEDAEASGETSHAPPEPEPEDGEGNQSLASSQESGGEPGAS